MLCHAGLHLLHCCFVQLPAVCCACETGDLKVLHERIAIVVQYAPLFTQHIVQSLLWDCGQLLGLGHGFHAEAG